MSKHTHTKNNTHNNLHTITHLSSTSSW